MKLQRLAIVVIFSLLFLLGGCSASLSLVGERMPDADAELVFDGMNVTITGQGVSLKKSGDVKITAAGVYELRGQSDSARIEIEPSDGGAVTLILAGVSLTCPDDEVILFKDSVSEAVVWLADGTENRLTSGKAAAVNDEADPDSDAEDEASGAALHAKCPLTLKGSGALAADGFINNGIASSVSLTVESGGYNIYAVNDGLKSKGDLTVKAGSFTLYAVQDAVQADGALTVNGGDWQVTTGAGSVDAAMKTGDSAMMGGGGPGGGMPRRSASGEASDESSSDEASASKEASTAEEASASDEITASEKASGEASAERPMSGEMPSFDFADLRDMDATDSGSHKGFKAVTALTVTGGSFVFDCEDDALHSDGTADITGGSLSISTGDDGIHGTERLSISDGSVDILYCYEGLEAKTIDISGGTVSIVATDDGMNANGSGGMFPPFASSEASGEPSETWLRISGGTVTVDSGGDGLDSNGDLFIEGGTVTISGPSTNWDAAIDSGEGCTFTVSGGILAAAGYSGMMETPERSDDMQGTIYYLLDDYAPDGETVTLTDSAGNVLLTRSFAHSFNCVLLSSPILAVGESYTLTVGADSYSITMDSLYVTNRASRGGPFGR